MSASSVTVFWRPGCLFCTGLRRSLDAQGLAYDAVDIWEDAAAAAFVRSVAGGNETVPTVTVGEFALVNPTATEVLETVARHAPTELPEDPYGASGATTRHEKVAGEADPEAAHVEDREATDRRVQANARSYAAIALGVAAVVVIPVITGPVALVLGILARNAEEPLARVSLWVAGVGTFLGLVNLFAAMGG